MPAGLDHDVRARMRTPRRRDWCPRRRSPTDAFESVADLLGRQRREIGGGDGDDASTAPFESYRCRSDLDLQAAITGSNLQFLARPQTEGLP